MSFYKENKVNPLPPASRWSRSCRSSSRCSTCCARTCGTTSARRSRRRRSTAAPDAVRRRAARRGFLFIPDLTDKATGGVLVVLIVLYVGSQLALDAADVDHDGPRPAHDLAGAAVRLRHLRHQLPGRPARLLDHHEQLDDRAADHRASKRLGPLRPPDAERHRPGSETSPASPRTAGDGTGAPAAKDRDPGHARRWSPRRRRCARPAPPACAAAQEEEAIRAAAMSDRAAADQLEDLLERRSPEALGVDAEVEVTEEPRPDPRRAPRRRPRALHRPPRRRRSTRSSTSPSRSPLATARRRAARSRWTPPATASGASRPSHRQADQAAGDGRCARGAPVALDAMSATERKVVHEYLKDRDGRGDLLRGHRARPPPRGRAAPPRLRTDRRPVRRLRVR